MRQGQVQRNRVAERCAAACEVVCGECRPLPGSTVLSKSTSAGSGERPRPASQLPNILGEGEDVQAAHPMQSPFGAAAPPPVQAEAADLPARHQGPAVRAEQPPEPRLVPNDSGHLLSASNRNSSDVFRFTTSSGSDHDRVCSLLLVCSKHMSKCTT